MAMPLALNCSLSSSVVPLQKGPRLVYLLAEISGGDGAETLPGNLAFVIDASESMRIRLVTDQQFADLAKNGRVREVLTDGVPAYQIDSPTGEWMANLPRRIDYVAAALEEASEYLQPADYFSLVAFAGWAHTMIPSISGRERERLRQAARELEHLRLGDETHMAEGLELGFAELQKRGNQRHAARMILLTDGHTLKVKECYEWADRARQQGYKLTTMGIGAEFNEDLLIPLADLTGGNAYYIETPDQIPQAFHQELGAVRRISYRNVELKLRLTRGVELRRVYRVLPELNEFEPGPNMDGSYALLIGDYDPGAPVALLMELVLPTWQEGAYRLAQAMLTWEDPAEEAPRQNTRMDIVVQMARLATARLDDRVMNIVEKVGAYKMGSQALETAQDASRSADPERKDMATLRLRQAATRLLDMGEKTLADTMLQQAQALELSGHLDAEATKKFRYETRRLTRRV